METWEQWDLYPHLEAPSPRGSEGAGRRQQEPGQESGHPKEVGQGCSQGAMCSPSSERLEPPRASWAKPWALRASSMCWPFKGCIVSSSSLGTGPEPHACHWPLDPPPSCTSAQDADPRAEQRSDCSKPSLSHASGACRAEQDLTGHPDVKDRAASGRERVQAGVPGGQPSGVPTPSSVPGGGPGETASVAPNPWVRVRSGTKGRDQDGASPQPTWRVPSPPCLFSLFH